MAVIIDKPEIIQAAGNKPKKIEEYFGRVRSDTSEVSIARMKSPAGWVEPGQRPDFNEYTLVIRGTLMVKTQDKEYYIKEGQAILISGGEWVQYSSPYDGGAEYVAVCIPAFSPDMVHRETND
jgi:mannose-6-phosphate isomerase-like protein (cupin superfamily)